jgi:manganese transport protein
MAYWVQEAPAVSLPLIMSTETVSRTVSRTVAAEPSLPEVYSTVGISRSPLYWRRLLGFLGPGFLISVGYMDPGNWATDIAGGSQFGYTLLFVIMLSNLMAILLQSLSLKLGVATERDLAQLCNESYGRKVSFVLWVLAEIAIAACDLAEVIGSAIALELLFHIPLFYGVLITGTDVLLILLLQRWGFRYIEALVIALIGTIIALFGVQTLLSRPDYWPMLRDLVVPSAAIITNPAMLYIAIGILGATVMPHNLYLHSSIVQSRRYQRTSEGKREAIHMANVDSALALMIALFVNAAILVVAAAVFHRHGLYNVAAIQDAYKLLTPMLGAAGASTLFAVALLASGQNSSITGTLAGQVVMEGFIHIRLSPWLRRLITRSLAIIPTIIVVALMGEEGTEKLLILSQVILSLQLSFAVVPLVIFTGDRKKMGEFVNSRGLQALAWVTAVVIAVLNGWLLVQTFMGS